MTSKDPVGATREAITTLAAAVLRVRREYGDTLGVRRLTSDVDRLQEDLDLLGQPEPGYSPEPNQDELLEIPDAPYDESMWADAQSEAQHAL
jgi:hypothetical protein